ncbi:MAG TPA: sugar transferase [Rectinema sp.]|nr:sugar transferase [Rectinema sp.]
MNTSYYFRFLRKTRMDGIAQLINVLLGDPSLRAEKAAQALEHAQRWTIGHLCDEMEELYLRIFGS